MPKQVSGILTGNIRVFSKFFLCACFEVKTITSTIEHNHIWISMRTDHRKINSCSRFIKKDSQCKQEYKSNSKPVDNSNNSHQTPNSSESPKTLSFGKQGCTTVQDNTTEYWPQNTPSHPVQVSAGNVRKKILIPQSLTLLIHRTFGKGRTSQKVKIWPNPTLFYLKTTIWDGTAATIWETASISEYPLPCWKTGEYVYI